MESTVSFGSHPPDDERRLAAHLSRGIRYACDLRSNSERRHYRNRLNDVPDIEYWCHDHDRLPGNLGRLIRQTPLTLARVKRQACESNN
jgi:hypothetical protein